MSKIYTKKGDYGKTNLYDSYEKINKDDGIFEVLGDLDELSSHIGMLITNLKEKEIIKFLRNIQNKLLEIGSDFATINKRHKIREITEEDIAELENYIDKMTDKLEPLKEFILPGGVNIMESQTHICRTVCRRVERHAWKVYEANKDRKTRIETYKYLNRLSDFLFTLARFLNDNNEIKRSEFNKNKQTE